MTKREERYMWVLAIVCGLAFGWWGVPLAVAIVVVVGFVDGYRTSASERRQRQ